MPNITGVSVDDPDGNMVENYSCNSERNYKPHDSQYNASRF